MMTTPELLALPKEQRPNYDPDSGKAFREMLFKIGAWIDEGQVKSEDSDSADN